MYTIAIHGGSGTINRSKITPEQEKQFRQDLEAAVDVVMTPVLVAVLRVARCFNRRQRLMGCSLILRHFLHLTKTKLVPGRNGFVTAEMNFNHLLALNAVVLPVFERGHNLARFYVDYVAG